jgi:hypothetical protein
MHADSPQINADIYLNTNKSRIRRIHHELINTNEPRIKRIKKHECITNKTNKLQIKLFKLQIKLLSNNSK